MPAEKNKALRILVPIILAAAVVSITALMITAPARKGAAPAPPAGEEAQRAEPPEDQPTDQTAAAAQQAPAAPEETDQAIDDAADEPAEQPGAGREAPPPAGASAPAPTAEELAALAGYRVRTFPVPAGGFASLGSTDPDGAFAVEVTFTPYGAGVESITLADHYETVEQQEHYTVQRKRTYQPGSGSVVTVASLAAVGLDIPLGESPPFFDLRSAGNGRSFWEEMAPGRFRAYVVDENDEPALRIDKTYLLDADSYEITIEQSVTNLTGRELPIRWYQYGPVDLPQDMTGYGGDKRRLRFGYLLNPERDPSQQWVESDDRLRNRSDIVKQAASEFERQRQAGAAFPRYETRVWPTDESINNDWTLSWTAFVNRYFAFAVHPPVALETFQTGDPVDKDFENIAEVYAVVLGYQTPDETVILQFNSPEKRVPAGGSVDLSVGAYAGPIWRKTLGDQPIYEALNLNQLIVFNFGGPCAFCTFQWLAQFLLAILGFLHDHVFFDWAIAIMFLVVVVRGVLHPVTKKSQISMLRFGKRMQALAPKQKKLQEKYRDDPQKMREEMTKLMREEGINPAQALGCLPMFLQTPIWIALYAMLYFTFDLRHEPAFFGLVQAITGGSWQFLADLSAPDSFIPLGAGFSIPLISGLMGPITSFNILPIVLGVVFFIQQKYLSPPPSASMTPEQQQQQKIMKVMLVVMFPVFIYNAPSGLAIYFITNSTLGILESRYIRSHVDKEDLENGSEKKTKRKRSGFMARIQAAAEEAQKRRAIQQAAGGKPSQRAQQQPASPFGKPKKQVREGSPYKRKKRK